MEGSPCSCRCCGQTFESSSVMLALGERAAKSLNMSSSFNMCWKTRRWESHTARATSSAPPALHYTCSPLGSWPNLFLEEHLKFVLQLTVRLLMPSENAPICLTVPSESSICNEHTVT